MSASAATRRRAGGTGQIEQQGRSHDASDCGTYRLVQRTAPGTWLVEWTALCDQPAERSTLRFVAPAQYWRHF